MRIVFRQLGGVTGLVRGCELETEELPAAERRRLQRLIDACDLERMAGARASDAPWGLAYRLRIERPEGVVTAAFDEAALPAEWEPLVDFLQRYLGPRAPE